MAGTDLVAPVLLVALPQVHDPYFRKSVVLLLAHEEQGSFGFIVNARTEVTMRELMEDLELTWGGDPDHRVHFGGPVESHVGTVLFSPSPGEDLSDLSSSSEVLPGIHLTQDRDELSRLAEHPPQRFRLLLGYAGWGSGQLLQELLRNDWLIAPPDPELVFGEDQERTWQRAVRSVGVEPDQLPVWTIPARPGEAN